MRLSFSPFLFFLFFLASFTTLSYFELSLTAQIWILAFGIIFPFILGFWLILENTAVSSQDQTFEPLDTPSGTLGLNVFLACTLIGLALLSRLYGLTTIPFWPMNDEGMCSSLSLSLLKKWNWNLLWTEGRMEPLLIWSAGIFFKVLHPSFFSFRFLTALLSLLTLAAAYIGSRSFFDRPTVQWVFTWFLAFTFWQLSLMRFFTQEGLILFFEMMALGTLGFYLRSKNSTHQNLWFTTLIFLNILGFYSYVSWAVVALGILIVLFFTAYRKTHPKSHPILFIIILLLCITPILRARSAPHEMDYIRYLFDPMEYPLLAAKYLDALFLNARPSFPYAPNWGGMFDPITGSLILIGSLYALTRSKKTVPLFIGLGLFLGMLPGVLTRTVELHRATPSLPFWIFLATLGFFTLIRNASNAKIWAAMILVCFSIFSVNIFSYLHFYCDIDRAPERQWRNDTQARVYNILKEIHRQTGPLYFFSEFSADYDTRTLDVTAYPFNALQNPEISASDPQWAVVMTNINYAPYFTRRFAGLRVDLLKDKDGQSHTDWPFALFLIPVPQIPPATLQEWIKADELYREMNANIKCKRITDQWSPLIDSVSALKGDLNDPFLAAVYWEQVGLFHLYDKDYEGARTAYQKAIECLPMPQFYYGLGVSFKGLHRDQEAQKAFSMLGH